MLCDLRRLSATLGARVGLNTFVFACLFDLFIDLFFWPKFKST